MKYGVKSQLKFETKGTSSCKE